MVRREDNFPGGNIFNGEENNDRAISEKNFDRTAANSTCANSAAASQACREARNKEVVYRPEVSVCARSNEGWLVL